MVKRMLLSACVLAGLLGAPRSALAGCTSDLLDCYTQAAKIDSFWSRSAAGLDCELAYAGCLREALIGA